MTQEELLILENMMGRIETLEGINNALIESIKTLTSAYNLLEADVKCFCNNYAYEMYGTEQRLRNSIPKIESVEETISKIIRDGKSICRFGDGEFACISGNLRAKFTKHFNEKLANRLKEILKSDNDRIMVGLADNYGSLELYSEQSRREIRHYMTDTIRREHNELLDLSRIYANAYITRPYILYEDKAGAGERFENIKQIWNGRDCIIVEGEKTRMGIGNDLFDGCKSIRRIICPAEDAYDVYDAILKESLKQSEDNLFLIALGPAATVLAYDLAINGRQALDIGHIDIEYEWYMSGNTVRQPTPYKYNNEYPGGDIVNDIDDEEYYGQIISTIK